MLKVSMIVPVYNVEPFLDRCLASLISQTLPELEILVINDSSPDGSQAIIDRYAKDYPHLIKPFLKPNGGVASVRNFGIDHARGEYIGYLDGDDYAEPDMVEKLYNAAHARQANFVISGFYFTYDDHEKEFHEEPYGNAKEMMIRMYATLWNKLYRRQFLLDNGLRFLEGCRYEDVSFLLKLAPLLEDKDFVRVNEPFIHYVQRPGSLMTSHNHRVKDIVKVFSDLLDEYRQAGRFTEFHEELEYLTIKYSLGQPFRSAVKIPDPQDRAVTVKLLYDQLVTNFPGWRKNRYLRETPGMKHLYFRTVNNFTYPLYAKLFHFL